MKKRLRIGLVLTVVIVLGLGPQITLATAARGVVDRTTEIAKRVAGSVPKFVNPVRPRFSSKLLSKRPTQDVGADPTGSVTVGGSALNVTTTVPGQNATVTFSGTSSQQITVHVTSNSMGSVTVKLLKPDGTTLTSTTSSSASFNLATQTLSVTGTYTISIDPGGANIGSMNVSVTSP